MPFFYHPDIKSQHFHFQFFSQGIFNIYDFISHNKTQLPYQDTFNYLPLTYYTFGIIHTVSKPFLGENFSSWLNNWGEAQNNDPNLPFYLFILKTPYLFLDISLGLLLFKIYKNKKLLLLWFFNPTSLYLIYILGNFDILPTILTVLSFYFLKKERHVFSYFTIGLAIALKIYPIIFLPFLLFYQKQSLSKLIKYSFIAVTPLIITLLPFLFQKSFFDAFLGSGLTQKLLQYRIFKIPVFPVFYLAIFLHYCFSNSQLKFEKSIFFLFLIFFGLVKFHPQWLLWFFPFVLVFYNSFKKINIFILSFLILIFVYIALFNDNFLTWGHLIPVDPSFILLTSPYQLIKLKTHFDPTYIQSQIHTILLLSGIAGILFYAKKK